MDDRAPESPIAIPSGLAFEAALARLEETLARLEDGGLTLEESILLFEQGMHLARHCNGLLDAAELHVAQLQAGFSEGAE